MNANTIEELDSMAQAFAAGDMDRRDVWSMTFLESWFVTYLGALYCMTLMGFMSREQCAEFKFRLAGIYRKYALDAVRFEEDMERKMTRDRLSSLKLSEAFRELRKDEPDAAVFIGALTQAVDLLTGTDVHLKLTAAALEQPEFEKQCQDYIRQHGDALLERTGQAIRPEDMMTLLEQFFAVKVDSGAAMVAASLDPDALRQFALRNIPVKSEYPQRIAKHLRESIEEKR